MKFLDTDFLKTGEIQLVLEKTVEADPAKNWLPAYHFAICDPEGVKMGVCDLRIGHNENVYYGGNIGYRVEAAYRGRHYAGKACLLLFELARRHGLEYVIITCNPDNWASQRTCEYAGGSLLEIAELPEDNAMRVEDGETEKCIYKFCISKQEEHSMDPNAFQAVHTAVSTAELNGEKVLRVIKAEKLMEFDENTYAKLTGSSFHNGVIEVDMLSRLLPDAPDFARGFIGIAFRINGDDTAFESYYVRPTNGRTDDPVRKAHGSQYFAYPKYTFAWFREHGITEYEAPVDIGLDEWIHLKAVVEDERAEFFVNGTLTLAVPDLKHGGRLRGAVGLFVDIGTEGFFKNLTITAADR